MPATDHLGAQFVGTYHATSDPEEYYAGKAEWLATGDPSKPLRWAREERD